MTDEPISTPEARAAKAVADLAASALRAPLPEGIVVSLDESSDTELRGDEFFLEGIASNIVSNAMETATKQLKQTTPAEQIRVAELLTDRHGIRPDRARRVLEKMLGRPINPPIGGLSEVELPICNSASKAAPELGLLSFDKLLNTTAIVTDRLIKGLIGEESVTVVAGPTGSAKTFLVLHLAICTGIARAFFDRATLQCGVLYIGAEGQAGIIKRVKAWAQEYGISDSDIPFALYPTPVDLVSDKNGVDAIIARVNWMRGRWPTVQRWMVIIDTLARCFGDGDESATRDMNTFVTRCDSIRTQCRAAVLVVHHFGKDESKGMRGSVALKAAADTVIEVTGTSGTRTAKVEKQKDGESGQTFTFTLKPVEIGTDEDGAAITSCVVEPAEPEAAPSRTVRLRPNQQTMLTVLQDAGAGGLSIEEWNARAREAGIGVKRGADHYDLRTALHGKKLVYEFNDRWYVSA